MTSHRNRVLVLSHDVISRNMAGPGIRYLELARVLSREFDVVLATPTESDLAPEPNIRLHGYNHGDWHKLRPALDGVDVIITTGFPVNEFPAIVEHGIPLVIDLYDPFPLENLYLFADAPFERKLEVHHIDHAILDIACATGDFFICAQPRQRDWWLGHLQASGRINPLTIEADPTLRALIDEVPFGLPSRPFQPTGDGPKTTVPGLSPDDKLILWGGGVWNWLDPLTLVRAMPAVVEREPRARLLFPGTRHPNPNVPEMQMTRDAIELAKALDLYDHVVFFSEWVPYEGWAAVLADADVAVSLHFNNVETDFSAVRSRVLGYVWARRPMVVTEGDAASRLVAEHGLGEVVPYESVEAVCEALVKLLAAGAAPYAPRFDAVAEELTWERVAEPLLSFCRAPRPAPDKVPAWDRNLAGGYAPLYRRQRARIEQLERLVEAYERGRFIRLMRGLDQVKHRLLNGR